MSKGRRKNVIKLHASCTRLIHVLASVQQLRRPPRVHFDRPDHRRLFTALSHDAEVFGNANVERCSEEHWHTVPFARDIERRRLAWKLSDILQRETAATIRHAIRGVHEHGIKQRNSKINATHT